MDSLNSILKIEAWHDPHSTPRMHHSPASLEFASLLLGLIYAPAVLLMGIRSGFLVTRSLHSKLLVTGLIMTSAYLGSVYVWRIATHPSEILKLSGLMVVFLCIVCALMLTFTVLAVTWRGDLEQFADKWVKALDHIYMGLVAVGSYKLIRDLFPDTDLEAIPGEYAVLLLATAIGVRLTKTNIEIFELHKSATDEQSPRATWFLGLLGRIGLIGCLGLTTAIVVANFTL